MQQEVADNVRANWLDLDADTRELLANKKYVLDAWWVAEAYLKHHTSALDMADHKRRAQLRANLERALGVLRPEANKKYKITAKHIKERRVELPGYSVMRQHAKIKKSIERTQKNVTGIWNAVHDDVFANKDYAGYELDVD